MQQQICPRCKFRLTSAKAICNTCGYALQSGRKGPEPAAAPRPTYQNSSNSQSGTNSSANSSNKLASAPAPSVRKAQAQSTPAPSGGSFWRAFFGLDPLPAESADRDDHALGET